MATTRTFQDMLNEYLPNDLLREEVIMRDYILSNIEKDDNWVGGDLVVPFKGASASSIKFGGLTDQDDIAESTYVRGKVEDQKEAWGTLQFYHRDLMEHGKLSDQNFLKILPDEIEDFVVNFKNVLSTMLLNGAHFATLTANGDASGNITVDRPDRFEKGQKVYVDDGDSSPALGYVRAIDMNTNVVTLYDARTGGSVVNLAGYTVAQGAKCYYEGAQADGFANLRDGLLSAANGGSSSLYTKTKTDYPYLQAINIDGATITSATVLQEIFNALVTICKKGKGKPTEVLMSLTNLGYCMGIIEAQKGSFNVIPGSQKASQFGWMEIEVMSVTKGKLKLVGIQEADDDILIFLDWRAIKFYSNGFFQKRKDPDTGNEYFTIRATSGYKYIVDICCFGEFVLQRPSYCGIIYNIDIPAAEGEV